MKRYDLITNYRCGGSIEEMEPSDDGEWARWDDVLEMHDRLVTERNDIDKKRTAEIERLRGWQADVTVAIGRSCGSFFSDVVTHIRDLIAERNQLLADIYHVGDALGIGAKPYSGHEAIERDFIPSILALREQAVAQDSAGSLLGDDPNGERVENKELS